MERITIKAKIAWEIVAVVISAIALVVSIGTTVYNDRYNVNVDAATTVQSSFTNNSSQISTGTFKPCSGTMKYGWAQTKGDSKIKYSLSYKKTSSSKYTCLKSNATFSKNNKYYGEYNVCKVNGKTNYNFKISKNNYRSTASRVVTDLMVV